jgi:hypothetical protein
MAGAKQHYDARFILVPAVGCTSSRGALGRCIAMHCGARRGGYKLGGRGGGASRSLRVD